MRSAVKRKPPRRREPATTARNWRTQGSDHRADESRNRRRIRSRAPAQEVQREALKPMYAPSDEADKRGEALTSSPRCMPAERGEQDDRKRDPVDDGHCAEPGSADGGRAYTCRRPRGRSSVG